MQYQMKTFTVSAVALNTVLMQQQTATLKL
jgi:hypothetical protein